MADIKITKDGVSNIIVGSMSFAQEVYLQVRDTLMKL